MDRPLTVAITTTLYVAAHPIMEVVSFVRQHLPETTIIVGDPFVAGSAREWPQEELPTLPSVIGGDVYIDSSEGELALGRVLEAIGAERTLRGIPNVTFREGSGFVFNDSETGSNSLEENMIDYRLFEPPR